MLVRPAIAQPGVFVSREDAARLARWAQRGHPFHADHPGQPAQVIRRGSPLRQIADEFFACQGRIHRGQYPGPGVGCFERGEQDFGVQLVQHDQTGSIDGGSSEVVALRNSTVEAFIRAADEAPALSATSLSAI